MLHDFKDIHSVSLCYGNDKLALVLRSADKLKKTLEGNARNAPIKNPPLTVSEVFSESSSSSSSSEESGDEEVSGDEVGNK